MSEVADITAGGDAPKQNMSKEKTNKFLFPIISNGVGMNAIYGYTDTAKINKEAVTIAARGTIGYAEYRDYPYYPIIRLISVIPKDANLLLTKYMYYVLSVQKYNVSKAGIPQLTVPTVKEVSIPIPPLEEQQRIVSILDRFEALTTDLQSGLPAEIEARRKQYEYYREQLLTFKRKTA